MFVLHITSSLLKFKIEFHNSKFDSIEKYLDDKSIATSDTTQIKCERSGFGAYSAQFIHKCGLPDAGLTLIVHANE